MEDLNQDTWPFIFLPHRAVPGEVALTPQCPPCLSYFPLLRFHRECAEDRIFESEDSKSILVWKPFPQPFQILPRVKHPFVHCFIPLCWNETCMFVNICRPALTILTVLKIENKTPKIDLCAHWNNELQTGCIFVSTLKRRAVFSNKYCWCPCWTLALSYSWKTCWGNLNVTRMGGYGCQLCSILCCFGPWPSGNILSISEIKHFLFRSTIMSKMCK